MGNGKKIPRNRGSSGRTLRGKKASLRGVKLGNFGSTKRKGWCLWDLWFYGCNKNRWFGNTFFFCYYIYIHVICFLSFFVCEDCKTKQNIYGVLDVFFWNNQDQFCSGMNEFGLVWSSGWQDFFWSISDQVHTDCRSSVRPIFFRNVGLSASIERRSNFPTPLNKQVNIWYWCGWND